MVGCVFHDAKLGVCKFVVAVTLVDQWLNNAPNLNYIFWPIRSLFKSGLGKRFESSEVCHVFSNISFYVMSQLYFNLI